MDFGNFIRGFFGLRHPKQDGCDDCTRKSEYQWSDESSEVRENSSPDNAFFHNRHFFNIVQPMDPFSIFQQMEDTFRDFFSFHSERKLDFPSMEDPFNEHEYIPRDLLLNPSERNFNDFWGVHRGNDGHSEFRNIESFNEPESPRDLVLKPSYRDLPKSLPVESAPHQDSDLDAADILQEFPLLSKPGQFFRKSVSTRIVRGSCGTMEEHCTVKDSSGNEVTTVRKSVGDQSYTVTLYKDKEGINEKIQDFVNLDEKDIPEFQERWHKIKECAPSKNLLQKPDSLLQNPSCDEQYTFIFKKLFGL